MIGKARAYEKAEIRKTLDQLRDRYKSLIFEYSLNPVLIDSFEKRLTHARNSGRDPERFLEEEFKEFQLVEKKAVSKAQAASQRQEIRRRRMEGETFADKVIEEYRKRIEHYPIVALHPDSDMEVARLYGAMDYLDKKHWSTVLTYLRRAFPGAGRIDRMSVEQRFWRFVSTRENRLPEALGAYQRILAAPSASNREKTHEAQQAITQVSFYLHELLDLCEQAGRNAPRSAEVDSAISYISDMIHNFRLKDLKKRL